MFKERKDVLCILFLIVITILSSVMYFGHTRTDSEGYIELVKYFRGENADFLYHWASRPLVPFFAYLLTPLFDVKVAFGIINVIFLCLTTTLLYVFFKDFFDDYKIGFITALLYPLSFPVILIGPQVLTDAAGNFFLVFLIFFIEKRFKMFNIRTFILFSLIVSLALLVRETLIVVFIYLLLSLLVRKKHFLIKKLKFFIVGILSLIVSFLPLFLWKYFTKTKSYSLTEGVKINADKLLSFKYFLVFIIRSGITFHIAWMFALIGFCLDKERVRRTVYYKLLLTLSPLVIIGYLASAYWHNYDLRHTFYLFLLILPLASYGLYSVSIFLKERYGVNEYLLMILSIVIYGLISFIGAYFVPETPIRNTFIDLNFINNLFS